MSLELIAVLVQIAIATVAIWYAFETRQLRVQNQEEIKYLKKQNRYSMAPFLIPGASKLTIERVIEIINDSDDTPEDKERKIESARKEAVFFAVQIDNPTTDKLASRVEVFIYDPQTKSYLSGDLGKEWVSPKETEVIQVTGPYYTLPEIIKDIENSYGNVASVFKDNLKESDEALGFVVAFFRDIEGTLYMAKREFRMTGFDISHKATKLFSSELL
jgi:hypothetical protein